MKLSPIHRRDFIKRLRSLGWEGPYSGGKHEYLRKGAFKIPIPNPHGSGEISTGMQKRILSEIGLTVEEWLKVQ